jgi:predicted acylesterase/phospholipase RssA
LSRSFNIIQRHADLAWRQQADVIIEPNMKTFLWDDFTRTPELVAAGEAATKEALPKIRELLGDLPGASGTETAGKDVISRQ